MREYDPNDHHEENCLDYLADMCIARQGFECAECGELNWTEVCAIICFINHVIEHRGDIERTPNNNQKVLKETHYHLDQALDGNTTDFEDATENQLRVLSTQREKLRLIIDMKTKKPTTTYRNALAEYFPVPKD